MILCVLLVGGAITILKNMKVNGKDDIPHIMENKKCLKPPTRMFFFNILAISPHLQQKIEVFNNSSQAYPEADQIFTLW